MSLAAAERRGILRAMRDGLPALALKLFHVAWMSVGLGIALELLAIVILLLSGGSSTALGVAANVLSRVSWSVVVCAALAVTTSLSRLSIPLSGVAGLLVAPSMTLITKSLQKMILTMLAGAQGGPAFGVLLTFAAIKGAEYLLLGLILALIGARGFGFLAAIAAGTVVGLLFACVVTAVNVLLGSPLAVILSGFINELLFPIGCSIILMGAEKLAAFMSAAMKPAETPAETPAR